MHPSKRPRDSSRSRDQTVRDPPAPTLTVTRTRKKEHPFAALIESIKKEAADGVSSLELNNKLQQDKLYRIKTNSPHHRDEVVDLVKQLLQSKQQTIYLASMPPNLKAILFIMNNNNRLMGTTWSPILQCADNSVQITSGNFTNVSNRDIFKVGTLVLWERILLSNKKLLPSKIGNAAPKVRITRELIILSACWVNGSASKFKMLKPLWTRCNETLLEECLSLTIPEKKAISENFQGTNPTNRNKDQRTTAREEISVTSSDSEIENPTIGDLDLSTDSEFSD